MQVKGYVRELHESFRYSECLSKTRCGIVNRTKRSFKPPSDTLWGGPTFSPGSLPSRLPSRPCRLLCSFHGRFVGRKQVATFQMLGGSFRVAGTSYGAQRCGASNKVCSSSRSTFETKVPEQYTPSTDHKGLTLAFQNGNLWQVFRCLSQRE